MILDNIQGLCTCTSFLLFLFVLSVSYLSCVYFCHLACIFVILRVLLSSYVYLLYYVCIDILTLDAGLLARSQYPEGPATGHLDTGVSWFPLCLQANAEMAPQFPSCYYMPLM